MLLIGLALLLSEPAHAITNDSSAANSVKASSTSSSMSSSSAKTNTSRTKLNLSQAKPEEKNYSLIWNLSMSGTQGDDDRSNQKSQFNLKAGLKFNMNFNSYFGLRLNSEISSTTGYIQSQESQNPEGSQVLLKHASADLKWQPYLLTSAGALNQQETHSGLLVDDRAFPAAKVTVRSADPEKPSMGIGAFAQSAVPTSTTLSNETQDKESVPSFNSAGLQAHFTDSPFKIRAQIASFRFASLPLSVSTSSVQKGNTGSSIYQTSYAFSNQYQGLEAQLNLKWDINRNLSLKENLASAQNNGAESGYNKAFMSESAAQWTQGAWGFIPSYTYFRIEPDAVVAAYNDSSMNTNRAGFAAGFAVQWKKMIRSGIKIGERVPLYESPILTHDRFVSVNLEVLDEAIH